MRRKSLTKVKKGAAELSLPWIGMRSLSEICMFIMMMFGAVVAGERRMNYAVGLLLVAEKYVHIG